MNDGPLLEAGELKRYYRIGGGLLRKDKTLRAVDGVGFALAKAETLAVVGESGCGKSTLARMVTMIEKPTAGSLKIDGIEVTTAGAEALKRLRPVVQMVFQNPFASLNPRKKVGSILEEPLIINTDMDAGQRQAAARDMMARVGLRPEYYSRYPHMFSGGQRQRIAIARALMLRPRIVVADEPVSALDVSIRAQVLNLLMDLQDEFDLAYLFISHDLSVVRHIADEVMVMYLGRAAEQGRKETIFQRPRHPYTKALLASTPAVDAGTRAKRIVLRGELPSPINPPGGCAFHSRCPHATPICIAERPELRPVDGRLVACHHAEIIA
ncbi:MAG TPA: peptide ABC transporter ATP-binding protein [Candidatus Udaeobacter sp.]|nr:peptide ABC transporter ATP-binding protein [Candidatus Udaeobacter sp.]